MRSPVRFRVKGTRRYLQPVTAYDGASVAPRLVRWMPPITGPNALLAGSLGTLRARSRDSVRQDGYAEAGVETLVSNIVGAGIKPQFATPDATFNRSLAELFLEWTDEADTEGRWDFYGLQALAVRSMIEGGDCFTRLRARLPEDGLSVPLQLQVIEGEHCPEAKNDGGSGDNRVVSGVEFDTIGRTFAYHLYRRHPYDGTWGNLVSPETVAVPAAEVAHLALTRRPGMVRGEPWLTRALVKMHDLSKYDDAQLVRQQIAALFTGFVTEDVPDPLGDEEALFGGPYDPDAGIELASLEPGTMQELPAGKSINWSEPPSPGDSYEAFVRQQMRAVATSLGILYEQLTGDFSGGNDRTFRAAVNEFRRRCAMWQHHIVVFQWCRPVLRRWAELGVLSGKIVLPQGITIGQVARAKWVPDGWAYIHPVQDVQSKELEVRAGFRSRAEVVSADGYDVEQVDAEIAADNARADKHGIVLDTDPRKTSRAGLTQARAPGTTLPDTSGEQDSGDNAG